MLYEWKECSEGEAREEEIVMEGIVLPPREHLLLKVVEFLHPCEVLLEYHSQEEWDILFLHLPQQALNYMVEHQVVGCTPIGVPTEELTHSLTNLRYFILQ